MAMPLRQRTNAVEKSFRGKRRMSKSVKEHPLVKPQVLLVNDHAASLMALESLLGRPNDEIDYEVVTARSGEEALRKVLNQQFAVILLDVSMPGMDGFETAEIIHSHPRSASTPIIFVTAHYADE